MTLIDLRDLLIWSLVSNYVILLVWFVAFTAAHDTVYRLHTRWFALSRRSFDALHYGGMTVYKVGILVLNLAPLAAILIAT